MIVQKYHVLHHQHNSYHLLHRQDSFAIAATIHHQRIHSTEQAKEVKKMGLPTPASALALEGLKSAPEALA